MSDSKQSRPTSVGALKDAIDALGLEIAGCPVTCVGVANDPPAGSLPRCLFLETRGCTDLNNGVIIIGENPGTASDSESALIKRLFAPGNDRAAAYSAYLEWFADAIQRNAFYALMRAVATLFGLTGPILWTELVKCENGAPVPVPGREKPVHFSLRQPFRSSTIQTCRDRYLRRELELAPATWPILAASLGTGDYLIETKTVPEGARSIISVPHPTGSRGDFFEIFTPTVVTTRESVRRKVELALSRHGDARVGTSDVD